MARAATLVARYDCRACQSNTFKTMRPSSLCPMWKAHSFTAGCACARTGHDVRNQPGCVQVVRPAGRSGWPAAVSKSRSRQRGCSAAAVASASSRARPSTSGGSCDVIEHDSMDMLRGSKRSCTFIQNGAPATTLMFTNCRLLKRTGVHPSVLCCTGNQSA